MPWENSASSTTRSSQRSCPIRQSADRQRFCLARFLALRGIGFGCGPGPQASAKTIPRDCAMCGCRNTMLQEAAAMNNLTRRLFVAAAAGLSAPLVVRAQDEAEHVKETDANAIEV